MAVTVHSTAIVDPRAVLEDDVEVGPYCIIDKGAVIGEGTRLMAHVVLSGEVVMGCGNTVYPFASIGAEPQDLGYSDEPARVEIGHNNVFREHVQIHRGSHKEDGTTRIGSNNFVMAASHIAHDVQMGSNIMMANACILGGHVHVKDYAILSGLVGVHQFATIGSYSFIGGCSRIPTDVPPYMMVEGNPAEVRCVNLVGLRRRGFSNHEIKSLTEAHRLLFRVRMQSIKARAILEDHDNLTEPVLNLFAFVEGLREGRNGRSRERKRAA
ncbi:Acyl-[acyl-carrier-protein]--UDP-N-acetylglucosamine O-acyltransferase [Planctomycetes bacterium Pan216]|uniref:Acyl-[acyl-carrier-protein]--UDP-N-acetylglucosamine O-acyltransferase n=1 Tax=Kolteria novifilia TaxID=2527975 RepID=A0A518B444_9BACT|nr:Acyl-[acyl-carrier-protein]--UDP-N-acetylglucosamine O-acyltransferase [Planctomycetes bacterium Pan216]